MINKETLNKMDVARYLLPDPGPEVVGQLIEEIRRKDAIILEAIGHFIWCTGSADFGVGGQAHEGWLKGPAIWLEERVKETDGAGGGRN